ncbi:multicopper oxidase family protein [Rhodococcoides yunnanense]|uniref:multicopper oxidase family protein n=1 Tax=Rhodococcoides yunnanense TaxID=278209 RepID=UPI0009354B0D|nr:multicopper oxidase domain-containing protein [Rhodococcus yunnanensis]
MARATRRPDGDSNPEDNPNADRKPEIDTGLSRRALFGSAATALATAGLGYYAGNWESGESTAGTGHHAQTTAATGYQPIRIDLPEDAYSELPGVTGFVRDITPFVDPLPIPPRVPLESFRGTSHAAITMVSQSVKLHRDLPPTPMWTYNGAALGPTIEIGRDERLRVAWENQISTPLPIVAVQGTVPVMPPYWDEYGVGDLRPIRDIAAIPPELVVHLHGAHSTGSSDGWGENTVSPGNAQLSEFLNRQPAAALWYHDHTMHLSRFTTYAGLTAGMYVIRDNEEAALDLPRGEFEIPLVVADRNFLTDPNGNVNGILVHKTVVFEEGPEPLMRPATGPVTMVNGMIWPYVDVQRRSYRFRILNAADIRAYRFDLVDETGAAVPEGTMVLIGTDGGLIHTPVPLDAPILVLPAERIDVIVDFARLPPGNYTLVNLAETAPDFRGILEFRTADGNPSQPSVIPDIISATAVSDATPNSDAITERAILITRANQFNAQLWELEVYTGSLPRLPADGFVQINRDDKTTTYRRVARSWSDPVSIEVVPDSWEKWTYISIEDVLDPHPMHIHNAHLSVIERRQLDTDGFLEFELADGTFGQGTESPMVVGDEVKVDEHERYRKDVIHARSLELVTALVRFGPNPGRFMHHCHIYGHEDHSMMRTFLSTDERSTNAIATHMNHTSKH